MRTISFHPVPEYGFSHPVEDIILGRKKTTTRKKDRTYSIGMLLEVASSNKIGGKRHYVRTGVIVEVVDAYPITEKEITEEYALRDGIHPTNGRSAKENMLAILKHFYGHIPREMQCIVLKHKGYTDDLSEIEWKKKVEEYEKFLNPHSIPIIR